MVAKQRIYSRIKLMEFGVIALKHVEQAEVEARKSRFDLVQCATNAHQPGTCPSIRKNCPRPTTKNCLRYVKFLGLPDSLVETLDAKMATANLLPLPSRRSMEVVIGQDIVNGEVVSTERMAVEIADMSQMVIKMSVREESAAQLKLGQPITFTAADAVVSGAISWISTEVDIKTRTVEVRSIVENPLVARRVGTIGKRHGCCERICLASAKSGSRRSHRPSWCPPKRCNGTGPSHVVFVRNGDAAFDMRQVEIGIETDEFTEIARWRPSRRAEWRSKAVTF